MQLDLHFDRLVVVDDGLLLNYPEHPLHWQASHAARGSEDHWHSQLPRDTPADVRFVTFRVIKHDHVAFSPPRPLGIQIFDEVE